MTNVASWASRVVYNSLFCCAKSRAEACVYAVCKSKVLSSNSHCRMECELKLEMKASCIALLPHSSAIGSLKLLFFFNFSNSLKYLSNVSPGFCFLVANKCLANTSLGVFMKRASSFSMATSKSVYPLIYLNTLELIQLRKAHYLFGILSWKSSI